MRTKFIPRLLFVFLIFCTPVFLVAHPLLKVNGYAITTKTNRASSFAGIAQPIIICSGASIVINGDDESTVPSSYSWEFLQSGNWVNAPGVYNVADYTPSLLVNSTNTDIVFSLRRKIILSGSVVYDSFFDVTVLASAPVTNNVVNAPAVNTFCSPGTPAIITGSTPTGGNGTFAYQWQSSADNVNFTNIAGATSGTYTPPQLTVTTYYRRSVNGGSCVAPSLSNAIGIIIIQPVTNNTVSAPAINSFCAASDPSAITGSTPTGGDGSYTYQWQSSTDNATFADIAGAVSISYDPGTVATTTYYRRSAFSGACSVPVYSNVATISIFPPITNNAISAPAVTTFCESGDPAIISGNTPSGGNSTYTYQWQRSTDGSTFTDIGGATANDYDPPLVSIATYYRRVATSGQCTSPVISNVVAITLIPLPPVPVPSQASVTICPGSTATLSVSSPQVGLTYNWYDSPSRANLLFTGTTYTTAVQTVNNVFYIESSNGSCPSATLATVQVNIIQPLTNNVVTAPAINNFCAASDPSAITGSTPTGGNGIYTYQWQSSTDNVTFTDIAGAASINYDPGTIAATTYYRRAAFSGGCSVPVYSNVITISIFPALTNNVISAPTVTAFCVSGDPAVISGNTPSGGNSTYAYQWQRSTDGSTFTDIAGATATDYDPSLVNTTIYYRRVATSGQCTSPVISNAVAITINPLPLVPVPSQASVTVCPGSTATLSVSSPQVGLTYNWYDSPSRANLLFTGTTYTTAAQTANNVFYIESSNGSCTSTTLAAVQVNIIQPVTNNVVTAPAINNFCAASDPAAISGSTPTGGNGSYTYQWQTSTDNTTFTDITGAVSISYDPGTIASTTYYRRSVFSGGCSVPVYSNVVTISILPALTNNVISAPAITTFCVSGDPAVISGNTPSGGNSTYAYQWQRSADGSTFTDIAGATATDYDPSLVNATTYYRRVATSGQCTSPVKSNVVSITLLPLPLVPVPSQASVTVCPGSPATLSVSSPQAGLTYNWYDSPSRANLLFTGTTYTTAAQTANNVFYIESSNGSCTSTTLAAVQVNIATPPAAPLVVSNTMSTCNSTSATIAVSSPQAGFTYNWYEASTGGSSIFTGTNYATPVLSANTTYYVEATNASGCISVSRTPVTVSIIPLPQVTVQGAAVCPGSNATLSATSSDATNVTVNWYASATGGSPISTGSTFTTPPLTNNVNYYVEVINNTTGCVSASRQVAQAALLQQLPAPVVNVNSATASTVTFSWGPIFDATAYKISLDNGVTYVDPSSGSNGLSHTVTGLVVNEPVSILVRAMSTSECQLSDNSVAVTAKAESQTDEIFVANAFTPNGDGKNDIVYVHSEGIKSLNFYVYSQWGEMLFNSADPASGWDGTFKGAKEPAGVYIYYLKAVMNNGHLLNKKGTITLLR